MSHLPAIISDLALILILAGGVTILFKWLKQPVVLGYIVAGFLASPHFKFTPSVVDAENISTWSEIGVVFLLFALGLEFSFKKLIKVGGTASVATFINLGSMVIIGYFIGHLLGWSHIDSLFLGGMLSMSSTTIIIKAFNDMNLQKQHFAGVVFGMLIVEDLAAILMMVLLSTLAVSQSFEGGQLIESVLKLGFFMLIWFVTGIYLIPTLLKRFKKYLNDETLLIISIGLCLGMVLFASNVGFSAALGAFVMGSILAETIEAERIEHLLLPVKNLFGAVFFVSVGMMIDPGMLIQYAVPILILTLVVLVGRIFFATVGVLVSGENLKVAVQSGFSLAQIGEFSFIIAALGISLGVTSDFLYPIIVAVSVITTFTTPFCIKFSEPAYRFINNHLSQSLKDKLSRYNSGYKTGNRQSDWNKLLKSMLRTVIIYFVLVIAILFVSLRFIVPFIETEISGFWGAFVSAGITLLLMSPFLWAIMMKNTYESEIYQKLWNDNRFNKGALISLLISRCLLVLAFVIYVLVKFFTIQISLLVIISLVIIVVLYYFSRHLQKQTEKMEAHFFENLNSRQQLQDQTKPVNKKLEDRLLNKDLHLADFEIPQNAFMIGKTLRELNFKQVCGVNIVSIIRGDSWINIPDGEEQLYPFDKIVVVGTDDQLAGFNALLETSIRQHSSERHANHHLLLVPFIVEAGSLFVGKTVKESHIREKENSMIISIEREGEEVSDFGSDFVFKEGDVLWLVGEKKGLDKFFAGK